MRDMVEQTPNERDEAIYAAWESGKKTLRGLAREFGCSVSEIGLAIDCCLPPFNTQTQMRAYKREIQKLEDVGTKYYAKAMEGEIESAHVYARINERYCAMQGWSSVNIRLDPYQVQAHEKPDSFDRIYAAITRVANESRQKKLSRSNGDAGADELPPCAVDTLLISDGTEQKT